MQEMQMSPSGMIFRALLLLLPALIAIFGGCLTHHVRESKLHARTIQLGTTFSLLGSAAASYLSDLPSLFWLLQLLLALPFGVHFVAGLPFVRTLTKTLIACRRWDLVLLGVSPILMASALWQLNAMTAVAEVALDENPQAPILVHELSESAYTDRGRHIHLFELQPESKDSFTVTGNDGLTKSGTPLPYRAIRLTEPDSGSNCSGWVFTGGHHLMQCNDVNMILEDNGYQTVKEPRMGDLVIYRNEDQVITHVGCVAFLLDGERPMVESKWGYQGVFLHLPEGSPFGLKWSFYRSSHHSHHILLTNPPSGVEVSP